MKLIKRDATEGSEVRSLSFFHSSLEFAEARSPERDDAGISEHSHPDVNAKIISDLKSRILELENSMQSAVEDARKLGIAEGAASAARRENDKIELLRGAIDKALQSLANQFQFERDIALELTRAALAKLFQDPAPYQSMVVDTVKLWASRLAESSIIELRVSSLDFDDSSTENLLKEVIPKVPVHFDPGLSPGECIFNLSLGRLDATIGKQYRNLDAILNDPGISGGGR